MLNVERLGVVLAPKEGYAKFNAGMVDDGDMVHMLYRWSKATKIWTGEKTGLAYEQDFIAYARLDKEGRLLYDSDRPLIAPSNAYNSAGCQDPRIVRFEGQYYIFYTCWNLDVCRVGVDITQDFQSTLHLGIIPTSCWDKDAFILPRRVNGKIAYIHRMEPDIQIDYFDQMSDLFDPAYWEGYQERVHNRVLIKSEYPWENKKVGGSVPPIPTKDGWLFLYHGVADDREPFCYRAGAALLDMDDPCRVAARLPYPILEPTEPYERVGDVNEVVFPQGAYLNDGWLYISYGGADKVVAMCRCRLDELLDELNKHRL